ncbi:MAG: DNA-3-methyladenine glycosylase family protein [Sarcina sp.]
MKIEYLEDKVLLIEAEDFDIKQILECGQCFRWDKVADNHYIGIAFGRVLEVIQEGTTVTFYNTNKEDFEAIWRRYFDLDRDYGKIKEELAKDSVLKEAVKYGYGIRVLNQEPFELVISFIISARNSIPVIKRTIKEISERWGEKVEYKGNIYYKFPTAKALSEVTEAEMKATGGSFRSRYIIDTSAKIYDAMRIKEGTLKVDNMEEYLNTYDLDRIITLEDDACHKALQNYNGVGAKVADCIMLFSMEKTSAFPVDVWIKRAMMHFYNENDASLVKMRIIARDKFKNLAGFAQQYLFYYVREMGIKI